MNRKQAHEILALYADDELDPQRADELKCCLAESTELRDELERWRAFRRCVNQVVTRAAVPAGLRERIVIELRRARPQPRYRTLRWAAGITAIAAAIALMYVVSWSSETTAEPRLLAGDSFAEIYLRCAVTHRHRGVEVDLHDANAARAKLIATESDAVLVPDLESLGFELDGVCRCLHVSGVKVVHVFYRRSDPDPAVVSFFTVDQKVRLKGCTCETCVGADGLPREYETTNCGDVMVCKWDTLERSYAVCSRMEHDRLRELVDGVKIASLGGAPMMLARAD